MGNSRKTPEKRRTPHGRWEEILDTAAEIFYTKGYDAASIQDVADALGMLKGSLYHYIHSKEDLLFGIVQRFHERGRQHLGEVLESQGPVLQVLREFVIRHVEHNARHVVESAVLNHDLRSLSTERRDEIVATRDAYDRFLRNLIARGKRGGQIRKTVDPKLASIGILSMLNSVYVWYQPHGSNSVAEVASTFADLTVNGVVAPPTTSRRSVDASRRSTAASF